MNEGCESKNSETLSCKENLDKEDKDKKIGAKVLNNIVKNKILKLAKKMENEKNKPPLA